MAKTVGIDLGTTNSVIAVMEAGEVILEPIVKEAAKRSFQPCFETTKIVAGELGADAVAVGAALLAHGA